MASVYGAGKVLQKTIILYGKLAGLCTLRYVRKSIIYLLMSMAFYGFIIDNLH